MAHDLSFPFNHSVNSGISEELSSITYARVDDAVKCILQLGVGTELAKVDLKECSQEHTYTPRRPPPPWNYLGRERVY